MIKKLTSQLLHTLKFCKVETLFYEKLILILAVFFHVATSNFPQVNLEWAFSDAALFFIENDNRYLDQYFTYQANTIAFPFLASVFSKIFPIISVNILTRILSAIGYYFLGQGLLKINRLIKTGLPGYILLLIVFFNPLIWTFGGRGTADFLPAALGIFGLAFYWENQIKGWKKYFSIFILAIAITLKYHAVLLIALIVIEIFFENGQNWKTSFQKAFSTVSEIIILPVLYILLVKYKLGFWLTPPIYLERHKLSVSDFFTNFIIYFGYLALLLLPFSIFSLWDIFRNIPLKSRLHSTFIFMVIGTILFSLGFFWLRPHGEMNFGPLDRLINLSITGGCFMFLAFIMGILVYKSIKQVFLYKENLSNAKRYNLCMIIGVVIFIFILSFTRPTQRYLMFILPFAYLFLSPKIYYCKKVNFFTIGIYIIVNLMLLYNQYVSGSASQIMVNEIRRRGVVEKTDGGAINPHAGNVFFRFRNNKKVYKIIDGNVMGSLYTSEAGFMPFPKKTYSLVTVH